MVGRQPPHPPHLLLEIPPVAVTTAPAPVDAAETVELPVAPAEVRALSAVQRRLGTVPVVATARGMSHFGEHAGGWLALGLLGALVDRSRRRDWFTATAGVAAAPVRCPRLVPRPPRRRRGPWGVDRREARGAQAPPGRPPGAGTGRHPEPAQLPVRARHLDHRRRGALRRPPRPQAHPRGRPPDGTVPAGPGRALPDGRGRGRPARRGGRRRHTPPVRKVRTMTDI